MFPIADGTEKLSGGEQELRTSTLTRKHNRGEDQQDFLGESKGSPPLHIQDSCLDAGEARNDF